MSRIKRHSTKAIFLAAISAFALALFLRHRYLGGMLCKRASFIWVMGMGIALCAVTPAQTMGFEDDDWQGRTSDDRFSGLPRKSGTFFRRVRKDEPEAQLEHAVALQEQGRLRAAGRHFNALVHQWPDADEAAEAQLALARVFRMRGRYERAFREYQYLVEHYAGEFPYKQVLSEQLDAARSVMEQRRGNFLFLPGFQSPERAIPLFKIVIANGPNWSEIPEIRLLIGNIYKDARDYADAIAAYEDVIVYHGRHDVAAEAIFRKGLVLDRVAKRNPRDARRTHAALQALFAALREDLTPEQEEEARERIRGLRKRLERLHLEKAEFYESRGRNPRAALMSYEDFLRRFPSSEQDAIVRERIAVLRQAIAEKEKTDE